MQTVKQYLSALVLALGLFGCNTQKTAEKMNPPALHYTDNGKGNTTLLFVHGWRINGSYWNSQVNYFKDKYRVVTVDLAGHGQSPATPNDTSIAQLAAGIDSVIRYLKLDSVVLIGHSMSGDINLQVYKNRPEKIMGFIGIDNLQELGHEPSAEEAAQTRQFFDTLRKDYKNIASQFSTGYLFHPKTDSTIRKRVMNDVLAGEPNQSVSILQSLSQQYRAEQEIIPQMKIPLLLIVSEGSMVSDSSHKKYCRAGYRFWTIKETGHYPMIEKPEEFNQKLAEAVQYALKR